MNYDNVHAACNFWAVVEMYVFKVPLIEGAGKKE